MMVMLNVSNFISIMSVILTITDIMNYLFEIIDPYSVNQQGNEIGQSIKRVDIVVDDHLIEASVH